MREYNHLLLNLIVLMVLFLNSHFTLLFAQCDSVLTLGNDTLVCQSDPLYLNAAIDCALSYEWQDGFTSPVYPVYGSGTYSCVVSIHGPNLVQNGDFSLGNTLFDTDYLLGSGGPWGTLSDAGTYAIATDPNDTHTNFSSCGDHTSGSGNMMVVNGSTIQNTVVWEQDLIVEENTDYRMAAWLISCVSDNPGTLKFTIDGVNVGSSFTSSSTTCSWQEFDEEWNSGSNTNITFSIVSLSGFAGGNDYAIDDITFYKVDEVTDSIEVVVQDYIPFDLGPDTILCEGQTITLDASVADAVYNWQDNSDFSFLNVIQEGFYWVDVSYGVCFQSDSIQIDYALIPDAFLGNDSNLCLTDSIFLNVSIDNASYLWQDGSVLPSYTITEEGVYWCEITLEQCVKSDTIQVLESSLETIDLGVDTSLCLGETLLLDAYNEGATYLWQDQSSESTFLVEEEGLYSVELISGSCTLEGTIFVDYLAAPQLSLGNDTVLCDGDSYVLDPGIQHASYLWQDFSIDTAFIVDEPGLYWLQVVDDYCTYITADSIYFDYDPIPYVDLGPDTTLCLGTEYILGSEFMGASFEWQDGSNEALYTSVDAGLYWLEISSHCGTAQDSILLDRIDCECMFFLPNSFTPNDDGDNEFFPPLYECNFLEFYFIIFNRWGQVVFETTDPYEQWDGRYQGEPVPMGVYPYHFQFLNFLEYRKGNGFVTLLR